LQDRRLLAKGAVARFVLGGLDPAIQAQRLPNSRTIWCVLNSYMFLLCIYATDGAGVLL